MEHQLPGWTLQRFVAPLYLRYKARWVKRDGYTLPKTFPPLERTLSAMSTILRMSPSELEPAALLQGVDSGELVSLWASCLRRALPAWASSSPSSSSSSFSSYSSSSSSSSFTSPPHRRPGCLWLSSECLFWSREVKGLSPCLTLYRGVPLLLLSLHYALPPGTRVAVVLEEGTNSNDRKTLSHCAHYFDMREEELRRDEGVCADSETGSRKGTPWLRWWGLAEGELSVTGTAVEKVVEEGLMDHASLRRELSHPRLSHHFLDTLQKRAEEGDWVWLHRMEA